MPKRTTNRNPTQTGTRKKGANIDRERFVQCMLARINETVGAELCREQNDRISEKKQL